jgi:hypothetical protein
MPEAPGVHSSELFPDVVEKVISAIFRRVGLFPLYFFP